MSRYAYSLNKGAFSPICAHGSRIFALSCLRCATGDQTSDVDGERRPHRGFIHGRTAIVESPIVEERGLASVGVRRNDAPDRLARSRGANVDVDRDPRRVRCDSSLLQRAVGNPCHDARSGRSIVKASAHCRCRTILRARIAGDRPPCGNASRGGSGPNPIAQSGQ